MDGPSRWTRPRRSLGYGEGGYKLPKRRPPAPSGRAIDEEALSGENVAYRNNQSYTQQADHRISLLNTLNRHGTRRVRHQQIQQALSKVPRNVSGPPIRASTSVRALLALRPALERQERKIERKRRQVKRTRSRASVTTPPTPSLADSNQPSRSARKLPKGTLSHPHSPAEMPQSAPPPGSHAPKTPTQSSTPRTSRRNRRLYRWVQDEAAHSAWLRPIRTAQLPSPNLRALRKERRRDYSYDSYLQECYSDYTGHGIRSVMENRRENPSTVAEQFVKHSRRRVDALKEQLAEMRRETGAAAQSVATSNLTGGGWTQEQRVVAAVRSSVDTCASLQPEFLGQETPGRTEPPLSPSLRSPDRPPPLVIDDSKTLTAHDEKVLASTSKAVRVRWALQEVVCESRVINAGNWQSLEAQSPRSRYRKRLLQPQSEPFLSHLRMPTLPTRHTPQWALRHGWKRFVYRLSVPAVLCDRLKVTMEADCQVNEVDNRQSWREDTDSVAGLCAPSCSWMRPELFVVALPARTVSSRQWGYGDQSSSSSVADSRLYGRTARRLNRNKPLVWKGVGSERSKVVTVVPGRLTPSRREALYQLFPVVSRDDPCLGVDSSTVTDVVTVHVVVVVHCSIRYCRRCYHVLRGDRLDCDHTTTDDMWGQVKGGSARDIFAGLRGLENPTPAELMFPLTTHLLRAGFRLRCLGLQDFTVALPRSMPLVRQHCEERATQRLRGTAESSRRPSLSTVRSYDLEASSTPDSAGGLHAGADASGAEAGLGTARSGICAPGGETAADSSQTEDGVEGVGGGAGSGISVRVTRRDGVVVLPGQSKTAAGGTKHAVTVANDYDCKQAIPVADSGEDKPSKPSGAASDSRDGEHSSPPLSRDFSDTTTHSSPTGSTQSPKPAEKKTLPPACRRALVGRWLSTVLRHIHMHPTGCSTQFAWRRERGDELLPMLFRWGALWRSVLPDHIVRQLRRVRALLAESAMQRSLGPGEPVLCVSLQSLLLLLASCGMPATVLARVQLRLFRVEWGADGAPVTTTLEAVQGYHGMHKDSRNSTISTPLRPSRPHSEVLQPAYRLVVDLSRASASLNADSVGAGALWSQLLLACHRFVGECPAGRTACETTSPAPQPATTLSGALVLVTALIGRDACSSTAFHRLTRFVVDRCMPGSVHDASAACTRCAQEVGGVSTGLGQDLEPALATLYAVMRGQVLRRLVREMVLCDLNSVALTNKLTVVTRYRWALHKRVEMQGMCARFSHHMQLVLEWVRRALMLERGSQRGHALPWLAYGPHFLLQFRYKLFTDESTPEKLPVSDVLELLPRHTRDTYATSLWYESVAARDLPAALSGARIVETLRTMLVMMGASDHVYDDLFGPTGLYRFRSRDARRFATDTLHPHRNDYLIRALTETQPTSHRPSESAGGDLVGAPVGPSVNLGEVGLVRFPNSAGSSSSIPVQHHGDPRVCSDMRAARVLNRYNWVVRGRVAGQRGRVARSVVQSENPQACGVSGDPLPSTGVFHMENMNGSANSADQLRVRERHSSRLSRLPLFAGGGQSSGGVGSSDPLHQEHGGSSSGGIGSSSDSGVGGAGTGSQVVASVTPRATPVRILENPLMAIAALIYCGYMIDPNAFSHILNVNKSRVVFSSYSYLSSKFLPSLVNRSTLDLIRKEEASSGHFRSGRQRQSTTFVRPSAIGLSTNFLNAANLQTAGHSPFNEFLELLNFAFQRIRHDAVPSDTRRRFEMTDQERKEAYAQVPVRCAEFLSACLDIFMQVLDDCLGGWRRWGGVQSAGDLSDDSEHEQEDHKSSDDPTMTAPSPHRHTPTQGAREGQFSHTTLAATRGCCLDHFNADLGSDLSRQLLKTGNRRPAVTQIRHDLLCYPVRVLPCDTVFHLLYQSSALSEALTSYSDQRADLALLSVMRYNKMLGEQLSHTVRSWESRKAQVLAECSAWVHVALQSSHAGGQKDVVSAGDSEMGMTSAEEESAEVPRAAWLANGLLRMYVHCYGYMNALLSWAQRQPSAVSRLLEESGGPASRPRKQAGPLLHTLRELVMAARGSRTALVENERLWLAFVDGVRFAEPMHTLDAVLDASGADLCWVWAWYHPVLAYMLDRFDPTRKTNDCAPRGGGPRPPAERKMTRSLRRSLAPSDDGAGPMDMQARLSRYLEVYCTASLVGAMGPFCRNGLTTKRNTQRRMDARGFAPSFFWGGMVRAPRSVCPLCPLRSVGFTPVTPAVPRKPSTGGWGKARASLSGAGMLDASSRALSPVLSPSPSPTHEESRPPRREESGDWRGTVRRVLQNDRIRALGMRRAEFGGGARWSSFLAEQAAKLVSSLGALPSDHTLVTRDADICFVPYQYLPSVAQLARPWGADTALDWQKREQELWFLDAILALRRVLLRQAASVGAVQTSITAVLGPQFAGLDEGFDGEESDHRGTRNEDDAPASNSVSWESLCFLLQVCKVD